MMARHLASGFSHPRQAHGEDHGCRARAERRRKMTAGARVGPQGRLMDNQGSMPLPYEQGDQETDDAVADEREKNQQRTAGRHHNRLGILLHGLHHAVA